MTRTSTLPLPILKEIDVFLEDFYPQSITAGKELAKVALGTSQIRGFETLTMSASRFSEIRNYIKNQTGKERKEPRWAVVAPTLLSQLDSLEQEAERMSGGNAERLLDIKLHLARGWARQVIAHYLYDLKVGVSNDHR